MPNQTKLSINYSVGVKANIGNYENASVHVSRSEEYDVDGMTREEIDSLYEERYAALNTEVSTLVEEEYKIMKG